MMFSVYRPAAWLRVMGADAATFLQGQFTNELRVLQKGGAVYGLWLNQRGKVIADSFVLRWGASGEFWIGSYFSSAATIRGRLEAYVIADDVVVEDLTSRWVGVAMIGEAAAASLSSSVTAPDFLFRGRRAGKESIEWVMPVEELDAAAARLRTEGATEISPEQLAALRIEAGIPAVPQDIGPGELPGEGDLEAAAISYTKGCYLGQEVMARLKSMGQVRRKLLRVRGEGENIPPLPAELYAGARKVGELRSAVAVDGRGFIGLALLSLLHTAPGMALAFAPNATPTLQLERTQNS